MLTSLPKKHHSITSSQKLLSKSTHIVITCPIILLNAYNTQTIPEKSSINLQKTSHFKKVCEAFFIHPVLNPAKLTRESGLN
jgi:hypothetical protein